MKNARLLAVLTIVATWFWSCLALATLNIYEPFNYSPGPLQGNTLNGTAGGFNAGTAQGFTWLRAGIADPPAGINVTSGSLTGPTELSSSIGNGLSITHVTGNDGASNRLALNQNYTSGTLYYSFLLNVTDLTNSNNQAGAFFFSFNNTGNISQTNNPTVQPGKVQVRIDPTDPTKYNLGVFGQTAATASSSAWASTKLDPNVTQLIFGSLNLGTKETRLWINPDPSTFGLGTEPAYTANVINTTTWTGNNVQSVLMRQNASLPNLIMDELRVGTSWFDVTPSLAFNIFKWEYIDPNDPSQGKRESTIVTAGGMGLRAQPGLNASGKNLSIAYLQAADLTGANLSSTNLANAYLNQANLTNASLTSATLTRADLSQVNLTNANLTGANLTGANISQAVLTGAIVKNAKLSSTHITLDQLSSTASYQNHDLAGVHFRGNDLSGVNLAGQYLGSADFYAAKLVGADFSNANMTMAELINADLSHANLTSANLTIGSIALANLSNANLSNANLSGTNLIGTNFTGADIRGASVGRIITNPGASVCRWCCGGSSYDPGSQSYVTGSGITVAQLATTANYAARDLSGITFQNNNFNGGNFAGFNLTNSNFSGTTLVGADLSGADARGAVGLGSVAAANFIRPDGHVAGVSLGAGQTLTIRDYDGTPSSGIIPIQVDQQLAMAADALLQLVFEADSWDSTISFAAGIPVTLDGGLELAFAAGMDPLSQIGRTFHIFDWTGVSPTGTFAIDSAYVWDLANLYTTGEVTLTAAGGSGSLDAPPLSVPEPTALILLCVGLVAAWTARRTRSTVALPAYRALACRILPVGLLVVACNRSLAEPPEIQLTKIGAPVWEPVDFQLFSAPATPFNQEFGAVYSTLLPYDSPLADPYVPHGPPYDTELSAGMLAGGFVSRSVFTAYDITLHPNGVYFAYMLVPDPGTTGSSRDFASGPVIPNSLFPIATNVDVWLDGVLVDRAPGADALIPVQPRDVAFQGTSHLEYPFAIWHPWDDDLTVGPLGSYDLRVSVRDTGGSGWDVVAPFQVVPDLPGDFNHDGTVDAADYVVWRKNPGGIYTQNDVNIWRAHFGQTAGSGASTNATVAEPGSAILLILGAAVVSSRRRRIPPGFHQPVRA